MWIIQLNLTERLSSTEADEGEEQDFGDHV